MKQSIIDRYGIKHKATLLLILAIGLLITLSIIRWQQANKQTEPPQLHFDATVATDLRTLANETWTQFLTTFAARTDCFGDVHLQVDRHLPARARYEPATATVTIKAPGTPAHLQGALVHEWAHHVEFQCNEHRTLRPLFLASLGLPPETEWRSGHEWVDTPSEHYAEAAIVLVLGERSLQTKIRVMPKSVAVLRRWAEGE
ncbi:MAG: hypothetical protein AAF639_46205 [Chloroflexota bacterium]